MCWCFIATLLACAGLGGGLNAEVRAAMLPDSLSTYLCPGGSVNSPSPVAPFHPGAVLRVAPVLRRSVPLIHLLLGPKSPRKCPNLPLLIFRERYGVREGWMGVYEEGQG